MERTIVSEAILLDVAVREDHCQLLQAGGAVSVVAGDALACLCILRQRRHFDTSPHKALDVEHAVQTMPRAEIRASLGTPIRDSDRDEHDEYHDLGYRGVSPTRHSDGRFVGYARALAEHEDLAERRKVGRKDDEVEPEQDDRDHRRADDSVGRIEGEYVRKRSTEQKRAQGCATPKQRERSQTTRRDQ